MSKIISCLFILIVMSACAGNSSQSQSINKSANITAPSPSPKSSPTPAIAENTVQQAIDEFINKNYNGYKLQGMSYVECGQYSSPCDLHLIKGQQQKVVTVIAKEFYRANGNVYWLVYEQRPIDLSQQKIDEIKDNVLENLTSDECQSFIDDARASGEL